MISNWDGASRSNRCARATYRVVSTNRLPLAASMPTRSRSTARSPGKLSNVRSSRNSSSRNVAGALPGAREVSRNASHASNASRAPPPLVLSSPYGWAGKGEASRTVFRKRSGVVATRSTSMYCDDVRPRRSRRRRRTEDLPAPQPPSSTGIRAPLPWEPSSADSTRRSSDGRSGIIIEVPRGAMKACRYRGRAPSGWRQDIPHPRGARPQARDRK